MSEPLFSIDVDVAPVVQALRAFDAGLQARINAASAVTAKNIQREARSRLQRQISPGHTRSVNSLLAEPARDGNGWIVLYDNPEMQNLGLWLEKGTKAGKRHNFASTQARPYFYSSAELEVDAHARRIEDAIADAATATGLGL